MKSLGMLVCVAALGLAGCDKAKDSDGVKSNLTQVGATKTLPDNVHNKEGAQDPHAAANAAHPGTAGGAEAKGFAAKGAVTETMNSGGYTYVQITSDDGPVWAAGPETEVKVGDTVAFSGGMSMTDFASPKLNRTFPLIYFVPMLVVNGEEGAAGAAAQVAAAHGAAANKAAPSTVAPGEVKKADHTIADVYEKQGELVGKSVTVRGKVVKYNSAILGTNWVHIQDGTGAAGRNDLAVTTSDVVAVGDTVLVKGSLSKDKDFGGGYKYDIIVENAKVTVE